MFIQTEATPNPATLKFLPGRAVMEAGTLDLRDAKGAEKSPLAKALFALEGVSGVFFGSDFVAVTKDAGEWQHMKPPILGAIMEHFLSGAPLMAEGGEAGPAESDEFFSPADAATVTTIKELLETASAPLWRVTAATSPSKGSRKASSISRCAGPVPAARPRLRR